MKLQIYFNFIIVFYLLLLCICFFHVYGPTGQLKKKKVGKLPKLFLSQPKDNELCYSIFTKTINPKKIMRRPDLTSDEDVFELTLKGCKYFKDYYGFSKVTTSVEEQNYPIAYVVLMHTKLHQALQMLSAIYGEQNVYCFHIDLKSPSVLWEAMKNAAKCLPNVHLTAKRVRVAYQSVYQLHGEINCMKDLLTISHTWKHLLNLCGMVYPLKTNLEIVRELKKLNGKNMIGGYLNPDEKVLLARTTYVAKLINHTLPNGNFEERMVRTKILKEPPPYDIKVRKNLEYNILSRSFVHWVLFESEKAKALLEWCRNIRGPEEHYWLMLDALPEAPGRTENGGKTVIPQLLNYYVWKQENSRLCRGYWRHYSCVFGIRDLPNLIKQPQLFANKFDISYDTLPTLCLRMLLDEVKLKESDTEKTN